MTQGVDRGGVPDGLVEHVDHPREQVDDVGSDLDLVQADVELARDPTCVVRVVGHCLELLVLTSEPDRVCVDARIVAFGEHGHDARVEAPAEERGHGRIGHQMRHDRVLHDLTEIRSRILRGGRRDLGNVPVPVHGQ